MNKLKTFNFLINAYFHIFLKVLIIFSFLQGLYKAVLIGSFGTMLGAWVKCGSISPDRFYVGFAGQVISAVSQIFILGIPARLAAVWFGSNQVSTACSIGVFGNQVRNES